MKQTYSISVGRRASEVQRVVELLFPLGFVFASHYRYKTWTQIRATYWLTDIEAISQILINVDNECKMVLYGFTYWDHEGLLKGCKEIKVEDFIKEFTEGRLCL